MGRFTFKLQAVLDQRLHFERQRQCELADAQRDLVAIEKQLSAAAESLSREGLKLLRGRVDATVLAAQARFSSAMRQKMARLRKELAAAQRGQETAEGALVEAAKARKVLEKLREKQEARWNEEQHRREIAAADDVSQRQMEAMDT
jgi:flagellar export protein FliJ